MSEHKLASIEYAVEAYRQGRFVIIVDDEDRENEGDFTIAADFVSADAINFMVTHGRGLVCLAMQADLLDRLQIPKMVPDEDNRSGFGTPFTVSIEASEGVSTGISTADRAHTIKTLIDPASTTADIAMPGHIFPLRAAEGGVLERRGQTEASVDLAKLAGLTPASAICEVLAKDGTMMRLPELQKLAASHDIPVISVEALAQHRLHTEQSVKDSTSPVSTGTTGAPQTPRTEQTVNQINAASAETPAESAAVANVSLYSESVLPTKHGEFHLAVFRDQQGLEHSALIKGDVTTSTPVVRLHSECLTGDTFGSLRCDCGEQLNTALAQINQHGTGVLLYLRQEGRGIGLGNKIRAYALQDSGLDTVEANHRLGFPADARSYEVAVAMLRTLNITNIRLLTNNPAKLNAMKSHGIEVTEQLPLIVQPQQHNAAYLQAKASRLGHHLSADVNAQTDLETNDVQPIQSQHS